MEDSFCQLIIDPTFSVLVCTYKVYKNDNNLSGGDTRRNVECNYSGRIYYTAGYYTRTHNNHLIADYNYSTTFIAIFDHKFLALI